MPSITSPFRTAGRLVADQVRRLHAALERLAGEVRAAIARAVGQAAGEAVREALRVILDGPPGRPAADDPPDDRQGLWGEPRRRTWPAPAYGPYAPDPDDTDPDDADDHADRRPFPSDEPPAAEGPAGPPNAGAWSRAVATGCQAAGWWLRRHPGRFAPAVALGVGLAAGAVTLLGGPCAAAWSALADAALGVLALADAAWSAAGLAAEALN
jgi:hypothetical protein